MKDRGIINELGLSLKHQNVIDEDHYQLGLAGKFGITVVQTLLNLYSRVALNHVIPFCKKNHIKILGRSPIAKGLLSGKYNESTKFSISDERSKFQLDNESILSNYKNSTIEEALLFSRSKVDGVIVGAKSFEQILQNFSIINQ
jgi:aryl-alcohol dehydrogenase-like predicted oxidoreductase